MVRKAPAPIACEIAPPRRLRSRFLECLRFFLLTSEKVEATLDAAEIGRRNVPVRPPLDPPAAVCASVEPADARGSPEIMNRVVRGFWVEHGGASLAVVANLLFWKVHSSLGRPCRSLNWRALRRKR
eukprot:GHVT01081141.1.p1 GENE.GHVT01081141.1~~GHVT01081141.1.p1  ORF type:complete len:127 (+),score=15.61 GHVT01081141.1:2228-2608(+)